MCFIHEIEKPKEKSRLAEWQTGECSEFTRTIQRPPAVFWQTSTNYSQLMKLQVATRCSFELQWKFHRIEHMLWCQRFSCSGTGWTQDAKGCKRQFSQIQVSQCATVHWNRVEICEICGNAWHPSSVSPGIVPWEAMETTPKFFVDRVLLLRASWLCRLDCPDMSRHVQDLIPIIPICNNLHSLNFE